MHPTSFWRCVIPVSMLEAVIDPSKELGRKAERDGPRREHDPENGERVTPHDFVRWIGHVA